MSAFLQSGRFYHGETPIFRVRFRPKADVGPIGTAYEFYISARTLARSIILSRSRRKAFLLASSRSAGIDENAVSIAMSFASAKLTFINCNSISILSKVRFDKSLSENVMGCDGRRWTCLMQRRSHHNCGLPAKTNLSAHVRFHQKRSVKSLGIELIDRLLSAISGRSSRM